MNESNVPPMPMNQAPVAPKSSGKATTSLVFGVLGLTCIPLIGSIVAVILGHLSQGEIKHSEGKLDGKGLSFAGIITGYVGIAFSIIVIPMMVAIAIPGFAAARETAQRNATVENLRQLAGASQQYALANDGVLPEKISDLDEYFVNGAPTSSPFNADGTQDYLLLYPGAATADFDNIYKTAIVEDQAALVHGFKIVGYGDGSAEWLELGAEE